MSFFGAFAAVTRARNCAVMRWETSFNGPASFYCSNAVARESFLILNGRSWQKVAIASLLK